MPSTEPLTLTNPLGRGKLRKTVGDQTEQHAERLLDMCVPLAKLRRRITPQKRGRDGKTIFLAKQGPDFEGMLLDGTARHIEIEAKRASGTSWRLDSLDSKQVDQLEETWQHGGIAIVMVIHGPVLATADTCMIPWLIVRERLLTLRLHPGVHGSASISAQDLRRYAVRQSVPPLYSRWLYSTETCWVRATAVATEAARSDPSPIRRSVWQLATTATRQATAT